MSREIRNVAKNWQHPKDERSGQYIPQYNEYYGDAIEEWIENHKLWQEGKHPDQKEGFFADYKFYGEFNTPPDIECYRTVKWTEEEACCFQVYETVSGGTPQSPIFETLEALENWLVETAGHSRSAAQRFCKVRSAPSMIMFNGAMASNIDSLDLLPTKAQGE